MATIRTVWVQNWEESERGWGTRPDGFTVHTSKTQLEEYVRWYYETFNKASEAPDEYTRISGDPIEIEVSESLFRKIEVACLRVVHDHKVNCVHGKASFFSTSPMRSLKKEDISW